MKSAERKVEFGTAYYPDHWPEAQWPRDLDLIQRIGIEVVRFGEFSWSWYEPRPGQFDFSGFDRFMKLIESRRLKLMLCTPTATLPPWLLKLHPDCRLMDVDGHYCLSHRHFWCWNHRESRALAETTIRTLVHRYQDHPSVIGYQVDNEPNYAESETIYDFNPHALADFREWLRDKYEDSLDALNRAWYTNFWSQRYGDWDEIGVLAPQRANPNHWLDFARWREQNLADMIRWQVSIIKEINPKLSVGVNIPETGVKFSALIGQDYFEQAKELDWVGTDLYMASGDRSADVRAMKFSTDLMRSAAGRARFVIAETQAGPHQRTWPQGFAGEAWDEDYLRTGVEEYVRHGAQGVWFFLFRPTPGGTEIGMNGLTGPAGQESERTELVRRLSRKHRKLLENRQAHQSRPLALIHYARDSIRFLSFWRASFEIIEKSLMGWHQLLDEAGYRIDFISDEQLAAGLESPAEVLVLPQSHLMSDPMIDAALSFGRHRRLIVGPHTAMLDMNGQLRQTQPGGALAEAAKIRLGFWHDVKTETRLRSVTKCAPINAYRALQDVPAERVRIRFAKPVDLPAIVQGPVTWLAFDAGATYAASHGAGRKRLARAILR